MGELPGWMDAAGKKKNINRRSRKQEKARAKEVDGKVQAGSGSSWRAPQDVRAPEHLEQVKFTDAAGYRITVAELERTLSDALRDGREPRFIIDFQRYGLRFVGTIERRGDRG